MKMKWEVGQTVDVQSRTWAGINKPGGCAKITKVHYAVNGSHIESLDVKYVLGGGFEKEIDPAIVSPFETLERGGRKRRGRDFFMDRADDVVKKVKQAFKSNNKAGATKKAKTKGQPKKTNDHSTSPSTPVTPEHPSISKAPSKKLSKTGKTLTVPSYVIASGSVEVSPLPLDRAIAESKKTSLARRGLFGGTSSSSKVAKQPAEAKMDDIKARDDEWRITANDVSKAHSAAVKNSLTKKQGRLPTQKKLPLADRKVDSVKAASKDAVPETSKISMKNVYDIEKRKARAFMDEMCQAPTKENEHDFDPASKENRLDTSGSEAEPEEDAKPAASDNRREEFLNLFHTYRRIFDDEDGTMEESAFRTLISQKAVKPFTEAELNANLEFLYQDGKLMKSDGVLYIVD